MDLFISRAGGEGSTDNRDNNQQHFGSVVSTMVGSLPAEARVAPRSRALLAGHGVFVAHAALAALV